MENHLSRLNIIHHLGVFAALFIIIDYAGAGVTIVDMPAPPARTSFDAWQLGESEPSADEQSSRAPAGAVALSRYGGQRSRAHSRYFPTPYRNVYSANSAYLYGDAYWYGYGYPYYGTYGFSGYYGHHGACGYSGVGLSFGVAGSRPAYRNPISHFRNTTQVRHFR
jgi:hypothetical protein